MNVTQAIDQYLDTVYLARSENTARTYSNGAKAFRAALAGGGIDPDNTPIESLEVDTIALFAKTLKHLAPSTERLYVTAVRGFFYYLMAEGLTINLPRLDILIRQRVRRLGVRIPKFDQDLVERVIDYVLALEIPEGDSEHIYDSRLRMLRDRALVLVLADTGLRIHEACGLLIGDIDWTRKRTVIIGKGDKQAVVLFSARSIAALQDYLQARESIDRQYGKRAKLPLFIGHDKGAGRGPSPMRTKTGQYIIGDLVARAAGPECVGLITPHSFRHYFITSIVRRTRDIKLAQELARHANIAMTERYTHLEDEYIEGQYRDLFG